MFVSHKNCHLDQLTAVMCEIKVVYSILPFKTYCCKLTNNSSHYKITISYLEFWAFTDFIHYVEGFYIRQSISEKRKYVVDINHWVLDSICIMETKYWTFHDTFVNIFTL